MNFLNIIFILTSIAIISCSPKETNTQITEHQSIQQPKDQIEFIREKYAVIESKLQSNTYTITTLIKETDYGSITYKRATDHNKTLYAFRSDCDDHGCSQTSYYFWDNKLIFKFDKNSSWVGQTDKISEQRTYYLNETAIRCLSKIKTGSGGFEAVNKQLSKVPNDTLKCNNTFDRSSIKNLLEFTNNEKKELAIIKNVGDGQYPMCNIEIHFIERDQTENIYINQEDIDLSGKSLYELAGKTVIAAYIDTHQFRYSNFTKPRII